MHRRMRESIKDGSSKNDEGGRRRLTSHGGANNLNLQGVMIWRTFTRNLRHRIQERRSERTAPSYATSEGRPSDGGLSEAKQTYQLGPEEKPSYEKYKARISALLADLLKDFQYEPEGCLKLSKSISEEVLSLVKSLSWPPRYKCVVTVTLGQKNGQGLQVSSLCAWDHQNDNYVTCTFSNSFLYCVVALYGVYYE